MKMHFKPHEPTLNTRISKNAYFSSFTLLDMAAHPKIFMQLTMQPYAPLETMQALIFGGWSFFLFSPPNFDLLIILLLVCLSLHILLPLVGYPITDGQLAIL